MFLLALILSLTASQPIHFVEQDSLPPLHTLKDQDISSVSSSFQGSTLTIVLNDSTLVYPHSSWDYENYYPSTPQRICDAITSIERTFTKSEVAAKFPGGFTKKQSKNW